ncbi:MAG: TIGR00730 family Rossman fold protein [Gemmatimonadetes bacterium]|nr:TIGR00730 family Rossman fold protein [Gemmatimonadota bacterium]
MRRAATGDSLEHDPFADVLHGHLLPTAAGQDEERVARIAVEALTSFQALAEVRRAVSVFGSARSEPVDRWGDLARRTSIALTRAGFAVMTGGGPGLMAVANEGALAGEGISVGLTIHLPAQEEPNGHLSLHVPFHYFFLRKLAFVKYACAFVCLPGGYGTLDELFEALNLKRTHRMHPFPVILMGATYWTGLREWMAGTCVPSGTLDARDLEALEITDDPEAVVARVQACHAGLCRKLGIHG